jgi:hypothetical protein
VALGVLPAPAQVSNGMHSVQPGVALVEVLFEFYLAFHFVYVSLD